MDLTATGADGSDDRERLDMNALLEKAMELIRTALSAGQHNQGFWLARGNENDTKMTAGALLSAWTTFVRRLDEEDHDLESLSQEELAALFIRSAYNHWRKKDRKDKKMEQHVRQANVAGADGEFLPFDPADAKSQHELMKILPDIIDIVLSTRSERDRLVISLWIEKFKYEEIVVRVKSAIPGVNISVTSVSRIIERFRDDVRKLFRDE